MNPLEVEGQRLFLIHFYSADYRTLQIIWYASNGPHTSKLVSEMNPSPQFSQGLYFFTNYRTLLLSSKYLKSSSLKQKDIYKKICTILTYQMPHLANVQSYNVKKAFVINFCIYDFCIILQCEIVIWTLCNQQTS